MGVAILGRQPLLLTLGAVIVCGLLERRRLISAIACSAAALAICVPVFMICGGVTPQTMAGNVAARTNAHLVVFGLVPWHIIYAMTYSGITITIVAPRSVDARWRAWAAVVAACVSICIIIKAKSQLPLQSVLGPAVPLTSRWIVEAACSGAMLGLAICFCMALLPTLWQHRTDTFVVLGGITILTQVVAAGAVRHQFSSRYL